MPRRKSDLSRSTSTARRMARYRATESASAREKRLTQTRLRISQVRAAETTPEREMRLRICRIRTANYRKRRQLRLRDQDANMLRSDAQNWIKYKMMGGGIKLKPGILPQRSKREIEDSFLVDKPCKTKETGEEFDVSLDNRSFSQINVCSSIDIKHEPLLNIVKTEPTTEPEEIFFQAVPDSCSEMFVDSLKTELEDPLPHDLCQDNTISINESCSHKDIQYNINTRKHVRSKATQVNMSVPMCSRATSPIIFEEGNKT